MFVNLSGLCGPDFRLSFKAFKQRIESTLMLIENQFTYNAKNTNPNNLDMCYSDMEKVHLHDCFIPEMSG